MTPASSFITDIRLASEMVPSSEEIIDVMVSFGTSFKQEGASVSCLLPLREGDITDPSKNETIGRMKMHTKQTSNTSSLKKTVHIQALARSCIPQLIT